MATQVQRIEAFIREVEIRILNQNHPLLDANGSHVNDFKVLHGRVSVDNNVITLQSVHPSSSGIQIAFPLDKVCYSRQNLINGYRSGSSIFIAILNEAYFSDSENHNLVKSLGHPTQYLQVVGRRGIPNPNPNLDPTIMDTLLDTDNILKTYFFLN
jgi:hypothetical protein